MNPYLVYIKVGAVALVLAIVGGTCWHLGGNASRTALETDHAAMAKAATDALLTQRAHAVAEAINDHAAETTHANDIATIDHAPPRTDPVIVYRNTVCQRAVPGAKAETGGLPADTQAGRSDGGRGVNIRAALNDLEVKYEKVLADYRQLDSEWPK